MSKVIFWIVVIFGVLFALRLINVAKAKRRKDEATPRPGPGTRPVTAAMVRCVRCGVFLPRTDALPSPAGYTCGDAGCAQHR